MHNTGLGAGVTTRSRRHGLSGCFHCVGFMFIEIESGPASVELTTRDAQQRLGAYWKRESLFSLIFHSTLAVRRTSVEIWIQPIRS